MLLQDTVKTALEVRKGALISFPTPPQEKERKGERKRARRGGF